MRKVTHAVGPLLPQRGRLQTVPRVEQGPGAWGRSGAGTAPREEMSHEGGQKPLPGASLSGSAEGPGSGVDWWASHDLGPGPARWKLPGLTS